MKLPHYLRIVCIDKREGALYHFWSDSAPAQESLLPPAIPGMVHINLRRSSGWGRLDVAESSAYEVAKQGGRHAGLLGTYQGKSVAEIQRALGSYERQAALHRQKMNSPETFARDWVRKSPRAQQGLLRHWQQDLTRNQELADVMRGILQERGIQ
jgi:hypothetical protein